MSQIAKELKIKTLNSCPKTQWQGSGSAFTPNQLNIKRSKNRITALATNTYEESGNLSSSTKSISSPSEPSANSNMDVNRASSTSQEQHKGTIVKWANVTSEHDIDSEPLTSSIMSEISEDMASPMTQPKVSGNHSEVASNFDCKSKNDNPLSFVNITKSLACLKLTVKDPFNEPRPTVCRTTESSTSNKQASKVDGEELIEIEDQNEEDRVIEMSSRNVFSSAFNFIDMVTELIDDFKDHLTIRSVESKIFEQKTNKSKKKGVYYANYPTDHKDDQRGGIIHDLHPTQCHQSRH